MSPPSWLKAGGFSLSASAISLWGYNEVSEGFAEWFSPGIVFFLHPSLWQRYWALILFSVFVCLARWGWAQGNSPGMIPCRCDPLSPLAATATSPPQQQGGKIWCHLHMKKCHCWAGTIPHWKNDAEGKMWFCVWQSVGKQINEGMSRWMESDLNNKSGNTTVIISNMELWSCTSTCMRVY